MLFNARLTQTQWRLVPMLVLLYLIAYIDKTNIGTYLPLTRSLESY